MLRSENKTKRILWGDFVSNFGQNRFYILRSVILKVVSSCKLLLFVHLSFVFDLNLILLSLLVTMILKIAFSLEITLIVSVKCLRVRRLHLN